MWQIIFILTSIGLACGILIFIVYRLLPREDESLKKAEAICEFLPGMNCGACGHPGCFAYAQAAAKNADEITKNPCTPVLQNQEMLEGLEKSLDIKLDNLSIKKKALVECGGDSEFLGYYSGVKTCKSASQLLGGFRKCPYACLGLGDCVRVCPQDAIEIDAEKNIVVVNPDKCTGCGLCVKECPKGIIKLVPENTKIAFLCSYEPIKEIPGRERCSYGCIHCKKCFKACEYDAIIWNKEKAIPEFDIEKCTLCNKCVEVCPANTLLNYSDFKAKVKALVKK